MVKYVLKRLFMMIPVMIGITFLIFLIISLTPGDPGRLILGPLATEVDVAALNHTLGFDRPFFVRFFTYLINILHGDFGKSYLTNLTVGESLLARAPTTVILVCLSIVLTVIVSVPVGIVSAVRQYSFLDGFSVLMAIFLSAVPVFWLGLILILTFSLWLNLFPATGVDNPLSFVLPTITMAAGTIAVVTRMTRTTMLGVIREDYIRTARAKGADERRIIRKHALRNALIPVVTVLGINFGTMLGGTVLVENVFGMPGIGTLLVDAIRSKDEPIILGCVIFLALCFSIINLIVDISYVYIDPRLAVQRRVR